VGVIAPAFVVAPAAAPAVAARDVPTPAVSSPEDGDVSNEIRRREIRGADGHARVRSGARRRGAARETRGRPLPRRGGGPG